MTKLKIKSSYLYLLIILLFNSAILSQVNDKYVDYKNPKKYKIISLKINGQGIVESNALISYSGLKEGDEITIPSDRFSQAIKKIWKTGYYSEVNFEIEKIINDDVYLIINVVEKRRLSKINITGLNKAQRKSLLENFTFYQGMRYSENYIQTIKHLTEKYLKEKGYLKPDININSKLNTEIANTDIINIDIKKGNKIKINSIEIEGNDALTKRKYPFNIILGENKKMFSDAKIRRGFKETKQKNIFRVWKRSKYLIKEFEDEKKALIEKYNHKSYKDAEIEFDTLYYHNDKTINIKLKINEGKSFKYRDINWYGNSLYSSEILSKLLNVTKGELYNPQKLNERLNMSADNSDISSLYMDEGHLFFRINPIEKIDEDSVDVDIMIYEGEKAIINKIIISGNTKTHDRVILREIRTKPGQIFKRSDLIRTQRDLANLGFFDPAQMGINPIPNPADKTVDIEYKLSEKSTDQVEMSAGYGSNQFVISLGLSFNNFSIQNIFNKKAWQPLPSGDGQKFSISASANTYYQNYGLAFSEPWFGGKKPINLFTSINYTRLNNTPNISRKDNSATWYDVFSINLGLGKRLKVPDDFFTASVSASYDYYTLKNQNSENSYFNITDPNFDFGFVNSLAFTFSLERNSLDQLIYPQQGSNMRFSFKSTLPYSLFDGNKDYSKLSTQEKYKWVEFNKTKFVLDLYNPISKNKKLVLFSSFGVGYLNKWNKNKELSPFERFQLGGNNMGGIRVRGLEYINLRGYEDGYLSSSTGDALITKFSAELRYPISLNPNATVYVYSFFDAADSWTSYKNYQPLKLKKSFGVGAKFFLPMFGLIGIDYGFPIDKLTPDDKGFYENDAPTGFGFDKGKFIFTMGMNIGEL